MSYDSRLETYPPNLLDWMEGVLEDTKCRVYVTARMNYTARSSGEFELKECLSLGSWGIFEAFDH